MALPFVLYAFAAGSPCFVGHRSARGGVMFDSDTLRQLPVTYVLGESNTACPLDAGVVAAGAAMIASATGVPFQVVEADTGNDVVVKTVDCESCSASRRGDGAMTIDLGACNNDAGNAAHEFLHALGLAHEQKHPDRGNYITVDINLVHTSWTDQWQESGDRSARTPFDFCSVMMYPLNHSLWPNAVTVTDAGWDAMEGCIAVNGALFPELQGMTAQQLRTRGVGSFQPQRLGLSVADADAVIALYNTTPVPTAAPPTAAPVPAEKEVKNEVPYIAIAVGAAVAVAVALVCACRRAAPAESPAEVGALF